MESEDLKALQSPLKAQYEADPDSAVVTLRAQAEGVDGIACRVDTSRALVEAGLHPATGGSGLQACSGDMLLEALVACAGVTFQAVATALNIDAKDLRVTAEGDLDFRGTLGVAQDAPVGFRNISLNFNFEADAPKGTLDKLIELTERYCVVFQTMKNRPALNVTQRRGVAAN